MQLINTELDPYIFFTRRTVEEWVAHPKWSLDTTGVAVTHYDPPRNTQYNPVFIAGIALCALRQYRNTRNDYYKNLFLRQANWLLDSAIIKRNAALWEYKFEQPVFGAKPPWISAMAQGMALSILVHAHSLTGNNLYLEIAQNAFKPFMVDMKDGGVRTSLGPDAVVYEEVAGKDIPSSKILNGFVFALAGLYEYWNYISCEEARKSFIHGINALKQLLPQYDGHIISLYDLHYQRVARRGEYNLVHVDQLIWLYKITNEPLFLKYALKFYSYERFIPYTAKTKGSNDPEGHGPEHLNLRGRYWAHNQFPTWVELDLGKVHTINRFTFFGYTPETTPKDYELCFLNNDKEKDYHLKIKNNSTLIKTHQIPNIKARYIQLIIHSDNGKKNTALVGFGVETPESNLWPVAVSECRSSLYDQHPPVHMVDSNTTTYWKSSQDTNSKIYVDLRNRIAGGIINIQGKNLNGLKLHGSNDLKEWDELTLNNITYGYRYLELQVGGTAVINEIKVGR